MHYEDEVTNDDARMVSVTVEPDTLWPPVHYSEEVWGAILYYSYSTTVLHQWCERLAGVIMRACDDRLDWTELDWG